MSHIHIPDGILAWWIWLPAMILVVGILFLIFKSWNQEEARRLVPLAAMMSALMLITMSVPLFIVPVHLTLAVLAGLMVGPKMAFLSILVVNTLLASLGHGGVTLIGLNTVIIGLEMFVGVMVFKLLSKVISTLPSAIIATVVGIALSLSLSFGLVVATVGLAEALPHEDHNHDHENHEDHEDHDHEHEEENQEENSEVEEDHGRTSFPVSNLFTMTLPTINHVDELTVLEESETKIKMLVVSHNVKGLLSELFVELETLGWEKVGRSNSHKGSYASEGVELFYHELHGNKGHIEFDLVLLDSDHNHDDHIDDVDHDHDDHDHDDHDHDDHDHDHDDIDTILSELNYLGFSGWLAVIMIYLMGITLESTATGFIYQSLKKVKKD
jgi:cobalt/nickel transport system permease protein